MKANHMVSILKVPPEIEQIIQDLDRREDRFDQNDVQQALSEVRKKLTDIDEDHKKGAWADILAFALSTGWSGESPWSTYFCPIGSGETADGKTVYFPDIDGTDPQTVAQWASRGTDLKHPLLKARYADLAWDMSRVIAKAKPDADMGGSLLIPILSAWHGSSQDIHDRFEAAIRALNLSVSLRDAARTDSARTALLKLHRGLVANRDPLWWRAIDRLLNAKNAGVTDEERAQLVKDLEDMALAQIVECSAHPEARNAESSPVSDVSEAGRLWLRDSLAFF